MMPMLSGWSEVITVAASTTTGARPGLRHHRPRLEWHVAQGRDAGEVARPAWSWILGRIYSTGTPEDYKAVHGLQDEFGVVPLSAWGKPYTPPPGVVDPSLT